MTPRTLPCSLPRSGHWVLAFPDADRAASAAQHSLEWAHKMRAVYCQLLHPLLHDAGGEEGSAAGSACSAQAAHAKQEAD